VDDDERTGRELGLGRLDERADGGDLFLNQEMHGGNQSEKKKRW